MKVLILNGSPRSHGCTARALEEVEKTLHEEGIETETVLVGNKDIRGCIACRSCASTGKCIFDDIVNEIAPKFESADGIIIGTPVYYAGSNGTILSLLDRLYDEVNKYFGICSMPIATSTYWNEVHGSKAEDVEKDKEGLQTMRNLGRNMAFLMKSIQLGKEKYGLPKNEKGTFTNFSDGL